jgi:hypothetical protein
MSDATNPDDDFRGTRETKRRDETVMIGQDSVASMVGDAKSSSTAAPAKPVDETSMLSGTRLILLAAGAVVILLVVIALVFNWVS